MIENIWISFFKMFKLFEDKKNNEKYWNKAKFYKQLVNKTLSIMKVLYLDYLILFLFDNTISYSIYANNTLYIEKINKYLNNKLS